MKINILTPGRFHVLDLARELEKNGYDVKFYSYVPSNRARAYGLPAKCSCSLFYILLPFLGLCRIFRCYSWPVYLRKVIQDWLTSIIMRKADVTISMSGEFVVSNRKAKKRGSLIIIERGSKHILEQKRILESIPSNKGKKPVPDVNVRRELADYKIADYVAIATEHVKRSFLINDYPEEKLFVNPYGVDLSMFKQTNDEKKYDVIFVGAWSYQKGCDLILPVVNELKIQFLHVGSIVDVPFYENDYCHHHDPVNQKDLLRYYNMSKVFLIPSRQEGLAMVQAQALACNLPVIGSIDSGAEDLKRMLSDTDRISIISEYSRDAIRDAIQKQLMAYSNQNSLSSQDLKKLTWEEYGKRYALFLNLILQR